MANDFLFTSESVSEGHPDKVPTRSLTRSWTPFSPKTRTAAWRPRH
jgi:hypothetical protein